MRSGDWLFVIYVQVVPVLLSLLALTFGKNHP